MPRTLSPLITRLLPLHLQTPSILSVPSRVRDKRKGNSAGPSYSSPSAGGGPFKAARSADLPVPLSVLFQADVAWGECGLCDQNGHKANACGHSARSKTLGKGKAHRGCASTSSPVMNATSVFPPRSKPSFPLDREALQHFVSKCRYIALLQHVLLQLGKTATLPGVVLIRVFWTIIVLVNMFGST